MELVKIRSLSDEELAHQEKTSAEQLFRLRFQVSLGQNDGVKKLRQVRKEIAQIKTVARERHLGIRGAVKDAAAPAAAPVAAAPAKPAKTAKAPKAEKPAKAAKTVKSAKAEKPAKTAKKGAAK
jgi:large subunit ribosomal protein L29